MQLDASGKLPLIDLLDKSNLKQFYANHVFHERHMNSCPIGCVGCAVSAVTTAKGSLAYQDLRDFYQDAKVQNVSLQITKVEGYDPVFVSYSDDKDIPFARTVVDAIDLGHQIITPVCTTGSWKADRTKWQLEELGKLSNKYRYYQYPSGNSGVGFVLSVPREIKQFNDGKYNAAEHVDKVSSDIELLTINGDIEVLIYYNSKLLGDHEFAQSLANQIESKLSPNARSRARLMVTNFNSETIPESCFRYTNSILVSDKGFTPIDPKCLDWTDDPNQLSQAEIAAKLASHI
ncbi:MAG: hypothetical protein LW817_08715 [Candidatus Caenarcaniphilales bacterium]|jgi:hypothetical protein|nr:hypothetical protein [Candidatus Caenarcaniphilales bacterium]